MAIICKYKFNSTLCADYLPEFNSEFTGYTKTDVDNGDNTITRTIEHDTLLPTLIRFGTTGDITDRERSLLELIECDTSNITNMYAMFFNCTLLTLINTSNFDTSKVNNMDDMFRDCVKLTSIDLSNFDTSNVTSMSRMFANCVLLTSLDLSSFNTSKVISMNLMFSDCTSLTSLDLSNFNTSKVTDMSYMFRNCKSLTSLDLSNFDTSNVISMSSMFYNCTSLTSLDLSNFNTSKVTSMSYMFWYCISLLSLDLSNFTINDKASTDGIFGYTPKLQDIGMVYCTKTTIDKISPLVEHTCNIYVNSIIPEDCTPVDGITFIFDGYVKTLYLNSPLLEGDTIEEKDGDIYHVHRYTKVVLDGVNNSGMRMHKDKQFNDDHTMLKISYTREDIKSVKSKYDNSLCNKLCWKEDIHNKASDTPCYSRSEFEWKLMISIPLTTNSDKAINTYLQSNPLIFVLPLATPTYELIEQSNLAIPSYTNGHLDLASAVPVSKVNFLHFEEELTYLYPSTSYTVQFTSDKAITADVTLGGTKLLAQNIVLGLNRISITTPSELVDNKLVIDGVGARISEVVVTDTNREFSYFEGMKSVGECEDLEVVSCNKNLFNTQSVVNKYSNKVTIIDNGIQVDNGIYELKDVININPDKQYTLSWNCEKISGEGTSGLEVVYTDGGSNYRIGEGNHIFTSDKGRTIDFIQITFSTGGVSNLTNIQIEESDTVTDYIPHAHNTQTLTHEPLRAVGDVKDRYVLIDGKWYIERKCGEAVLDGSKNYLIYKTSDNYIACYPPLTYNFKSDNCICSNTVNNALNVYNCDNEGIWCNSTNKYLYLCLNMNKLTTKDIIGFKEYLSINPYKAIYQLASPVYEPIDYNPLEVYSDVTHITTNSTIPTNIIIKNHGFNCLLKPSTTYTISSNLGLNTVTTPSTLTEDCLRFMDTDTSDVTTMKNVLVLEGDWTTKADLIPANFSGIESAFEQELVTDETDENYSKYRVTAKVVGKNKFKGYDDISEIKGGLLYLLSSSAVSTPTRFKFRVYDRNMKEITELASRTYGIYYNASRKYFITGSDAPKLNKIKLDMPNNAKYLQPIENDQRYIDIQLEQGDTATTYEPYKESNIVLYINEPLRGVGDVKDRVYIKDDKVVVQRNCEEVVLDGSDDETIINYTNGVKTHAFGIRNGIDNVQYMRICLSNNFIGYGSSLAGANEKDREDIVIGGSVAPFVIYINKNKLQTQDVTGFRQWLQQNPTTVVYQLAEPTYEEVKYSSNRLILNTFNNESFNNSTLFLDTNISPKLSFKPLYEELVYVKNSTKYYIQFNAVGSGEVVINLGGTELTTEIVEGYNCIPITTPSESTNLMTISGQGITISEVVVSEVICGGYYKGLQSCFEEHMENGKYRVLLRGIALDGSKVNGIKLYINEPLRGVGDVKDRLCIKNGKLMVERKYGSVILDGSDDEMYTEDNVNLSGRNNYSAYYSNENIGTGGSYRDPNKLLCDKMSTYAYDYVTGNFGDETGVASISERILVSVPKTKLATIDLDGFRNYLNTSPMTFIYQLATPTYEEATNEYGLPIVFEGYENGIVYIDSAVTPTTHIKYTSNNQLATTLSEAEEQNISTQEDINMNVITYMMDIDMMLTDMEMSNDISVMAVRRDNSNENMLDRMSEEDKKVYRDNTVVMLEKMITAKVLDKEDIEGRIDMYYNKNRISKEQYKYLKSLL